VSAGTEGRLVAGLLAAVILSACGAAAGGTGNGSVPTATASVVRTDIVSRQQLPGTLTYAGSYSIINPAGPGVFTRIPATGTVVYRGQVLYWVNGRPIPLLYGDPEWRPLAAGVSDGADIRTLQVNLVALGFGSSVRVDNHFDWVTAAAVRRWQASLGVPVTGAMMPGDAVYVAGPIRISAVHLTAGSPAQPGQPVLDATSPQHAVLLAVDVARQSLIRSGELVAVSLPDGTTVQGVVSSIGTVAVPSDSGNGNGNSSWPPAGATIAVTVALPDPAAGGTLDQAPVEVSVTYDTHPNVLAVPVSALLAEPGGTYAVEVIDGGARRLVRVTTGLFDDRGLVEVSSAGLREGMSVEVPRA